MFIVVVRLDMIFKPVIAYIGNLTGHEFAEVVAIHDGPKAIVGQARFLNVRPGKKVFKVLSVARANKKKMI